MPPADSQITAVLVVFAVAFITALIAIVRRAPAYIDARVMEYSKNSETNRKRTESEAAADLEEEHGKTALAIASAEVMKVFVTTQPEISTTLRRLTDLYEGQRSEIGTVKNDVAEINHTLKTGSPPLLSIGKRVEDIYNTVNEIKQAPSLSEDKAQRIEKAIADISAVTPQLTQLVVALQETQAELLQRKYDSGKLKPIANYIEPEKSLTRDALDSASDGKPQA